MWYDGSMSLPEWINIARLGVPRARRTPDASGVAMAEIGLGGRVRSVNEAGVRAFGWTEGSRVAPSLERSLGELEPGQARVLPSNGRRPTVLGVRMKEAAGWLIAGSEPEQRANGGEGSRFRSLIEKIPVCITVLRPDGVAVYANPEAENLTGYSPQEIEGRPFWLDAAHPEDRWKLLGALRRVKEGERAVAVVRILSKRHGPRLTEMHLSASRHDAEQTLECVVFDITERSEVEEALFQSEALYRVFLEQSPIGMLHLDAEGIVTFENHQIRQIIGEDVEEVWIGRSIFSIEGIEARIRPLLKSMLEQGDAFHSEVVAYRSPHAGKQQLKMHGSPILHPDGGIVGAVVMIEDRSEESRRKDELALRSRYSSAESSLRKAALADPTGDTLLSEAARILGECTSADRSYLLLNNAAGDCCTDRACWTREGIPEPDPVVILPDEMSRVNLLATARERVHVVSHDPSAPDRWLLEKTGAMESVWIPFYDDQRLGGFLVIERVRMTTDGASSTWQDTELQLIGPLVRLFETLWSWILVGSRYRHITGTIDDCLFNFTFDEDGERRFLFVTPQIQTLTGYHPAEIVAQDELFVRWSDAVVHETDRILVDTHDETLRAGRESRTTYRVQHVDGTIRWLQERATPETDAMGDVLVSGILTDVTEQKAAEGILKEAKRQAESANRMKSAFIATMSHEIRTPMGAVNGFAELLTRELAEHEEAQNIQLPDQVLEFLQAIRENSKRLLTLVNDLFDLSNLEMGSIDLRRTTTPLHDLVMRSTSKIAVRLSQKSVDLHVDFDSSDPLIVGDPQRIEQVFDNLLSNAEKFTESGSVSIRTRCVAEEFAVVEVSDTGVGISEDHLQRLFEPFVQEDSRLNRRFEGSGLGLSLAKRLLELMSGRIEVESIKGEGTTFRVSLPLARPNVVGSGSPHVYPG